MYGVFDTPVFGPAVNSCDWYVQSCVPLNGLPTGNHRFLSSQIVTPAPPCIADGFRSSIFMQYESRYFFPGFSVGFFSASRKKNTAVVVSLVFGTMRIEYGADVNTLSSSSITPGLCTPNHGPICRPFFGAEKSPLPIRFVADDARSRARPF